MSSRPDTIGKLTVISRNNRHGLDTTVIEHAYYRDYTALQAVIGRNLRGPYGVVTRDDEEVSIDQCYITTVRFLPDK